jgi:hypothetical protein
VSDSTQLDGALALIEQVLSGEVAYESHPEVFDDDVFLFCVRRVEREAPNWLLNQIVDPRWPLEHRENLVDWLHTLQEQGRKALDGAGREDRI